MMIPLVKKRKLKTLWREKQTAMETKYLPWHQVFHFFYFTHLLCSV